MKYAIILSSLLTSFVIAKENTSQIKVDGMVCSYSCGGKVTNIVQKIDGVKDCSIDFKTGIATVVYDDKKVDDKMVVNNLIKNTSYKAKVMEGCDSKKKLEKI